MEVHTAQVCILDTELPFKDTSQVCANLRMLFWRAWTLRDGAQQERW